MASSSSALASYEAEYKSHVAAAEAKIEQAEAADREDDRRAAASSGDRAIEAAKDVVQLLELEGRGLPSLARSDLQSRIRAYRSHIHDLKARIKGARTPVPSNDRIREELFADHSLGPDRAERERMIAHEDRIGRQTDKIRNCHSTVLDMEHTAGAIMNDLHSQRESLLRTKSTLAHAGEGLEQSRRLLRSMARRAAANKCVLYLVIGLMCGIVLLALYWQLFPASSAAPAAAPAAGGDEWKVVAKP